MLTPSRTVRGHLEKAVIFLLLLLILLPANRVLAGGGRGYLGAQAGMFLPIESNVTGQFTGESGKLTYNPGVFVSAVGGYRVSRSTRVEAEVNFRRLTTDRLYVGASSSAVDADIRSQGFMANFYYDFINSTAVTPFIGAGVGFAWVEFDRGTSNGALLWKSDGDLSVAYQGIGGFAVELTDNTYLDFAYRHFAIPRLHFEQLSAQFRGPTLCLGIRHWF